MVAARALRSLPLMSMLVVARSTPAPTASAVDRRWRSSDPDTVDTNWLAAVLPVREPVPEAVESDDKLLLSVPEIVPVAKSFPLQSVAIQFLRSLHVTLKHDPVVPPGSVIS